MNAAIQKKNNITIEGNLNAAETIVFAHGFGTDKTAWNWIKDDFKSQYRLILFDNVGAGGADPNDYIASRYKNLDAYVNDLLDIAETLELKSAIVVAHSVSSMITLMAAIRSPERFSKLIFMNASPRYLNDAAAGYVGGFTQEALDSMYSAMTGNYYAWANGFSELAMGNPDQPELARQFAYTLSAIRPDIALEVARVIFESDVRPMLSQLNKQVLLLHSWDDIAVPTEVGYYLHEHIKNSTLKFINSTGHFPHISSPGAVVGAIKGFIGQ